MNIPFSKRMVAACFGLVFVAAASAAQADDWQYELTPYLLAAGMSGTVGVRNVTTEVNPSFGDIADHLDAGFMGLFAAQNGPWTLSLEGVYMKLSGSGSHTRSGPEGIFSLNSSMDVSSALYVAQGSVGYRLVDQATKLDLIGALRYTQVDADADLVTRVQPGVVFPDGGRSASGSEGWTDAVIGVRVIQPLAENWSLLGYADVGAGGSDLTYQVIAGVNWDYAKGFTAKLGYRYLYWDYADGGTVWDMAASGSYLGLGIHF
ncbi:MAG: hypothetical protein B7Y40_06540 [Gammaproteobacteria bacterium 28-57-27]|nr:MAG: hypothetical protein B7Y40_06540 [Gammaproteobacteria bacterium 28-57-27]